MTTSINATEKQLKRALTYANVKGRLQPALNYLERQGVLCFGVEKVSCAGRSIFYINLGETYTPTIIREGGEFSISSWGAWYEEVENEHCQESGEIRCGYCGEFTESAEEWSETICNHCGHNVASGELPAIVASKEE